ncbi:MAG TPA: ATP-dependent Clp protease proteolytic subunit [Terracidiphilus sp.]|nr:ATP-dependent Clp protease proteolytic subunit [Terracidiphilus sp.]
MITPNKDFRLNPSRALYVTGELNDDIVARLTPKILALQSQNRDPICVYINSPGGSPASTEALLNLLRLSDQDSTEPCRIITAVTVQAASAAADLLASGDYAIAFPKSKILHHGVRQLSGRESTFESTARLNEALRISNSIYAMRLAQRSEDRFTFRFYSARDEFAELRKRKNEPALGDYECFVEVVKEKLSPDAGKIFDKALKRAERYKALFASAASSSDLMSKAETTQQVQALIIKAIVDFEVSSANSASPTDFRFGGMRQLVDDFYILNEYLTGNTDQRLERWCTTFGRLALTREQEAEIDGITDETERSKKLVEINKPILQPMLAFFIAMCHALQEGENELSATDAYWLGLVDEVVGEELWNLRLLYEFEEDEEEKAESDGKENTETPVPESGTEVPAGT